MPCSPVAFIINTEYVVFESFLFLFVFGFGLLKLGSAKWLFNRLNAYSIEIEVANQWWKYGFYVGLPRFLLNHLCGKSLFHFRKFNSNNIKVAF